MKRLPVWFSLLFILVSSAGAFAQKGTFTTYTTTWNGFQRIYAVYVPPKLAANPAMVMCLHQTVPGPQNNPPTVLCAQGLGWNQYSDMFGFLLVTPVSTWKSGGAAGGWFFWQAYNTNSYFPIPPDDSGFLRNLIQTLSPQYNVNPARVFVTGFSSGAMMSHRMGIDSADLVAAIAPVSGAVWVGTSTLPSAAMPVSVLEYHGDADPLVKYCGGTLFTWNEAVPTPAMDADVNYWLAQDGMSANSTPLCSSGTPTPNLYSLDFKSGNVEVEFLRELGVAHTYHTSLDAAIWAFFAGHGR